MKLNVDPKLVVPDEKKSISDGAIEPWSKSSTMYYAQTLSALAKHYDFSLNDKWSKIQKNIKDIKSGKFKVQSKLDLHGFSLKEAETLFFEFLKKSFNSKKRNILVISGKGERGKGKIKLSIPVWISSSSLSHLIHFYSLAAPKDGGNGAYYIRLRKKEIF